MSKCYDCGLDYGDPGFQDLIVSNDVWRRISPTGDNGGLFCPTCLVRALSKAGIKTEGAFMSGPIINVTEATMEALRRVENLEERLSRASNRIARNDSNGIESDQTRDNIRCFGILSDERWE